MLFQWPGLSEFVAWPIEFNLWSIENETWPIEFNSRSIENETWPIELNSRSIEVENAADRTSYAANNTPVAAENLQAGSISTAPTL